MWVYVDSFQYEMILISVSSIFNTSHFPCNVYFAHQMFLYIQYCYKHIYISQSHEKQTLYGDYFQNSPLSILSITKMLFLFWIETWKLIETCRIDMILWRLKEFRLVWINFENCIWNFIHRKVCSMKQDRSIVQIFLWVSESCAI